MGREEIRAPLKTPAWEATKTADNNSCLGHCHVSENREYVQELCSCCMSQHVLSLCERRVHFLHFEMLRSLSR